MTNTSGRGRLSAQDFEHAGELRLELQRFLRSSESIIRKHGLTAERYQLLLLIKLESECEQGATVSGLASALQLAKSTVTQLVRRAEDLRLVRRELADHDARIRYLRLTKEGDRRLTAAVAELAEERSRLIALLTTLKTVPAPRSGDREPRPPATRKQPLLPSPPPRTMTADTGAARRQRGPSSRLKKSYY